MPTATELQRAIETKTPYPMPGLISFYTTCSGDVRVPLVTQPTMLTASLASFYTRPTRVKFDELAGAWKHDTRFTSSLAKKVMHPAYQAIIGMGREALPLIFEELQRSHDHWLWALHAITQEDPAPEDSDFKTAVAAWLGWGRVHAYL